MNTIMSTEKPNILHINETLELSKKILKEFTDYRRLTEDHSSCKDSDCLSIHLNKIMSSVRAKETISFVLPAFPGKSPNTNKVLGTLPDLAEKLSLSFLGKLCQKVKKLYPPGVKIIICSDGRVFSDVVGMHEDDVSSYQIELDKLIKEMSLKDISTFNLDHVYKDLSYDQMRTELMKTHGQSLEYLKYKVRSGSKPLASFENLEANRMYKGITRFLFEDSLTSKQSKSRSAIQKEAKARAYQVIRRSNAWSDLIEKLFPKAVRLSIHPQGCGSKKLGIRLIANESWMTPWHGVALKSSKGYELVKRSEAKDLGAKLIFDTKGCPSHYEL